MKKRVLSGVLSGWLLLSGSAQSNPVLEWNAQMMAAIRLETTGPTLSSRNLAILHLAIYDAVNSVARIAQPYQVMLEAPLDTSAEAAAMAAGHEVMRALYPSLNGSTDNLFELEMGSLASTASLTNGLELGRRVAQLTLESRKGDGSTTQIPYIPSADPGQWRRTPPFFRPPLDPHWGLVQLFALPDKGPFMPPPPPSMKSREYADALNEVKELGRKVSAVRTAEQSDIAVFWSDFSYTAMPPGHWHEIAASIARERGVPFTECARLFGLISLAQADSAIVCWLTKFKYNTWRPVTAIQRADEDGNEQTEPDRTWESHLISPPFPEYTSGHSTFSAASARVLATYFGTDALEFSAVSDSLPGVRRSFTSLAACADEIGMSRIYGGIHFAFANREGKRCGARIGSYVCGNYLIPNDELPATWMEGATETGTRVRVHGHVGAECVLESSSDMVQWTEVGRVTGKPGGSVVVDAAPLAEKRFYRVRE